MLILCKVCLLMCVDDVCDDVMDDCVCWCVVGVCFYI